jgi:hypothetical protein
VTNNGRVDQNGRTGILVTGTSNSVKNNAAGSAASKGNGQHGIQVTGGNNTLDSNKANANAGDGFNISGASTKLRYNQSNTGSSGSTKENVGAEYRLIVPAINLGGNKADNIGIPKTTAPRKCPTFPAAGVCE